METSSELLSRAVALATPALLRLTEADTRSARKPGAWTPRQVLGHLIDSACNNHARFVRAQLQDGLICQGYDQEAWVAVQQYADAPWGELVTLWSSYNRHLARMVAAIPAEVLTRPRVEHNLDEVAWRRVPRNQAVTLEYFVRDYIGHLENHLTQVLSDYRPLSFTPGNLANS